MGQKSAPAQIWRNKKAHALEFNAPQRKLLWQAPLHRCIRRLREWLSSRPSRTQRLRLTATRRLPPQRSPISSACRFPVSGKAMLQPDAQAQARKEPEREPQAWLLPEPERVLPVWLLLAWPPELPSSLQASWRAPPSSLPVSSPLPLSWLPAFSLLRPSWLPASWPPGPPS